MTAGMVRRCAVATVLATVMTVMSMSTAGAQAPTEAGVPNFDHLIGDQYVGGTKLVRRWEDRGGTVLDDGRDLWMSVWKTPKGRYVFVTQRLLRRTSAGLPVWRVLDTATSRTNRGRSRYWVAPGDCRRDSTELPAIGLARGNDPYYNPAIELWRWQSPSGKLTRRPVDDITCFTGNPD